LAREARLLSAQVLLTRKWLGAQVLLSAEGLRLSAKVLASEWLRAQVLRAQRLLLNALSWELLAL
jgi:hypothetical protein